MRRAAREPPGTMESGGVYTCRQLSGGSSCTHGDNSFSYIHTHSYTHTYTRMYTHNTHTRMYIHNTQHIHTYTCAHTTHTYEHTLHIHICTNTTHMYIDSTHTYTYVHRQHIHTNTYTHTSVRFSRSVVSDSSRPHESQHTRPPCPSPTPGLHSDSRPSSQ